jgi:hypothetical protein
MSDLRSKMIRMASELPQGDPTRRKLLAAVQDKTAYGIKDLEVDLGNLTDGYTRSEVSDWGVNTIRDGWSDVLKMYVEAQTPKIDGRKLMEQMVREEFARIKKGNLGFIEYLRVARRGSEFRLNRKMRMAIYAHYASKMAR